MPRCAIRPVRDPDDRARFLQALYEGVAKVEALGYRRLAEAGAPAPRRIHTVGGGARSVAWTAIRERSVGAPMCRPRHTEAAAGVARLALRAIESGDGPRG